MIELTTTVVGAAQVLQNLVRFGDQARADVRKTVQSLGLELQRKVKEKLSDDVLHVQTGRLRRSVNEQTTESGGEITSSVGTAVVYARAHELGFTGTVQVREHQRRTPSGALALVRAHPRAMNLPARPFLRPALEEMRARVVEQLTSAIRGAV